MSSNEKQIPLKGSTKHHLPAAQLSGAVPPGEFQVTVMVRRRAPLPAATHHAKIKDRTYLTREQLASRHGASAADIAKVQAFAAEHNLKVVDADPAKRHVILSGTTENYNRAFGVDLKMYKSHETTYRGRAGDILIPESLSSIVTSVTGLDNRPFARPHFRVRRPDQAKAMTAASRGVGAPHASASPVPAGFSPVQLAQLYNFAPSDGTGQTIAILELGGGYNVSDLSTYFQQIGVTQPNVTTASYPGGGTNNPGTNAFAQGNPDVEVALDVEVAGGIAPGANIVVYFGPDATDQSFLGALNAIVHDTVNNPNVVSISWGGPEVTASAQFQTEFDQILQSAAQLGITVCVAAGDNGSADFAANDPNWDGTSHVDFPASSPNLLACGGTNLSASSTSINSEVVWFDAPNDGTGGGVSRFFAQPMYQQNVENQPAVNPPGAVMRGVPDVAGDAAPGTGYQVLCDGQAFPDPTQGVPPVGGTSAVAPLWAGLVARLNQSLGKPVGFLNPLLYAMPSTGNAFNDITQGTNGDYTATPGWDPCTGLGSPNGQNLLAALK